MRRLACAPLVATAVAVAVAVVGCGSATVHELPPAAEPASSPPAGSTPPGRIVAVGAGPEGVAADPAAGRFAVALRDPDQLALVGVDGSVLRRVALPGAARHLTFDAVNDRFLVPAESANRLLEITAAGAVATNVAVGPHPHDSAAVDGRVFIGDEGAATVSVVAGNRAVGRFPVATQPGGLAGADDGRLLAVVSVRERRLELYDPRTDRRVATAPAGVGPTHVVGFEERLYVADTRGDALLIYHVHPKLILYRRVQLAGAPYGMAIDPVRRRLWVTLTATNELVGLNADSGARTLIRLPTVRQPDSVAVDPGSGRVFVTGRDAGVVEIVTP